MEDSHLTNFFSPWEDLSKTSETTEEYEARLKKILTQEARLKKIIDDEAKIDYARHKGKEEGKEEVVRNMLSEGLSLEQVAKYAKLTIKQVKEIQSLLEY